MRRAISVLAVMSFVLFAALPVGAAEELDGPSPAIWLSDPDGVDGDAGIEQNDPIEGSSGFARVNKNGATISVKATGLEPGHAYTVWVAYFNDSSICVDGCNGPDLNPAGGGLIYGTGRVALQNGTARFTFRLKNGAGEESVGDTPPPPFAFAPYQAGPNNEFHVVLRSHGPLIDGQVVEQLTTFGGGCVVNVGPRPEQQGDFPVPLAPGECGEIQLYVFK